jgi:hypothetical protein
VDKVTRKASNSGRKALFQDNMESLSIKGKEFRELSEHQSFAQSKRQLPLPCSRVTTATLRTAICQLL